MSDEYQSIPVAAARAAVQESGQLDGIEGPHFLSGQSVDWRPYFAPSADGIRRPDFARVVITRKGQRPREVVISWDEYAEQMDADPAWDAIREKKPMSVFGAEVERHAYRVVFADVLAAAFPPIERPAQALGVEPWAPPARDWIAEVKAADAKALNALYDEAREAGALAKVEGLQAAIMDRMLTLGDKPTPQPRRVGDALAPKRSPGQGNRRRGRR